eukprot:TRINITY_DN480_c0_g1_i3.p1 TRINITY_DN480_c0_g1~~TRINITY_DN480_c0_g1_i3.p1  ORF type:complete len:274 (+),score=121.92 TRINITY_DN480_c0_g1_i3:57-878(+)
MIAALSVAAAALAGAKASEPVQVVLQGEAISTYQVPSNGTGKPGAELPFDVPWYGGEEGGRVMMTSVPDALQGWVLYRLGTSPIVGAGGGSVAITCSSPPCRVAMYMWRQPPVSAGSSGAWNNADFLNSVSGSWVRSSCAPKFYMQDSVAMPAECRFPMTAFLKQDLEFESIEMPTEGVMYLAIFATNDEKASALGLCGPNAAETASLKGGAAKQQSAEGATATEQKQQPAEDKKAPAAAESEPAGRTAITLSAQKPCVDPTAILAASIQIGQ